MGKTAGEICSRLKEAGILAIGISDKQIRMVTHCDVNPADIVMTTEALLKILA